MVKKNVSSRSIFSWLRLKDLGLMSLSLTSISSAIVIRHDVPDANYQALGQGSLVGAATGIVSTDISFGTGVLIDNEWIITAAHVAEGTTSSSIFFGNSLSTLTSSASISQWFIHPSWTGNANYSFESAGFDIAVGRLATAVNTITPARIFSETDASNFIGDEILSIGFGRTGTGLTGAISGTFGTKRGATNVIDATYSTWTLGNPLSASRTLFTDFDNPNNPADNLLAANGSSPIPTAYEGELAPGDSGGGVFNQLIAGNFLVGIHSGVFALGIGLGGDGVLDMDYGDGSMFAPLAPHLDWIASTTNVQPVPEPSSMLVLGAASALGLFRRRRK